MWGKDTVWDGKRQLHEGRKLVILLIQFTHPLSSSWSCSSGRDTKLMEAIKITNCCNLNQQSFFLPESFSNLNTEVMHIKSVSVWQTLFQRSYLHCFFIFNYILILIFETVSILILYIIDIPIPAARSVSHLLSFTLHSVLWWCSHQRWQVQSLCDWFWLTKKTVECC